MTAITECAEFQTYTVHDPMPDAAGAGRCMLRSSGGGRALAQHASILSMLPRVAAQACCPELRPSEPKKYLDWPGWPNSRGKGQAGRRRRVISPGDGYVPAWLCRPRSRRAKRVLDRWKRPSTHRPSALCRPGSAGRFPVGHCGCSTAGSARLLADRRLYAGPAPPTVSNCIQAGAVICF